MGDADDSYDFTALSPFLEKLRDGYELVMGNRFAGGIAPGAMPPLHRFLGNPVLSSAGRVLFHAPIRDFHCGLRGFDTQRMREIGLRTPGMEFASEMVVKSTLAGLRMTEVPTTLSPDGRSRPPHLRSWSDGWRHLRFLLLYSPRWLFLYPGLILMPVGALVMVTLATGPLRIGAVTLDINTIMFAAVAIVVGFDAVTFARAVEVIASRRAEPSRPRVFEALDRVLTLEKSLIIGVILLLLGVSAAFYAFNMWSLAGYGPLSPTASIRITIVSGTAIILGLQVILSSFFLGILRDEPGLP